jgi:diguanylate cyclase (GGDEF)-like protein/putative nucleotidyltransferase with HDIG domain
MTMEQPARDVFPSLISPSGYIAGGLAAASFIYSVLQVPSFSITMLIVLAASIFVSAIVGRYEVEVPRTGITFKPKDLMAFWGIIWLGLPGGIILSLAASLSEALSGTDKRVKRYVPVAIDMVSGLVSAATFYLFLDLLRTFNIGGNSGVLNIRNEFLIAGCAMGVAHFASRYGMDILINPVKTEPIIERRFSDSALSVIASYSLHIFSTVVLYFVFNYFGIEFGLVILPMVVAGHLAYKIHTRRLEAKTRQITEASRLHLATVEALATAIDARDQVGVGHVRRTQIYALGIGKALGLGEDELNALRMGALLHDIGKLAVPDHILNKPGKLTPAEMEKTKIHSLVGASILENVGFPYPVIPAVKYHHESWDGTGYPEGLMGTQIPLTARILTVADVYDTLRGARPYRKAVPAHEALVLVRREAGHKFDPTIVKTLIANLPVFEAEIEAEGLSYQDDADAGVFVTPNTAESVPPNYVQQIKRANREVFTLYSLAKEFGATADINDTLSLFTEKIGELAPYDTCVVYLYDKSTGIATAKHVDGANKSDLINKTIVPGEGATGYVLETMQSVQNVDPALDFAFSDADFSRDYIAMASLPLIADETIVGAVSLYSRSVACYADEHIRLLDTVSLIATDAIVRSQQLAEAESHALTDPMTGLPNSRGLQHQFEKEAKRAGRSGLTFQVLVLDLDGFKAVNDTHGHKVGDTMLREVAQVMKDQFRDYDFLARYGGDEFVAIVPDTETIDVLELSRRIEKSVADYTLEVGDKTARVGVSIGSASYPAQGETFDQIIVAADKAMYITKAIHRKRRLGISISQEMPIPKLDIKEVDLPMEFRIKRPEPDHNEDALVLELDERHIVTSSAIN